MQIDKPTALKAILSAIEELNLSLEEDKRIAADAQTPLMGPDSTIDSLNLVSVVSAAEENLYDAWGVEVLLASEEAMSRRRSPYRTPETLAEYAVEVAQADAA